MRSRKSSNLFPFTGGYATAHDLAADVQRYLGNDPVSASPPSLLYRAGKFAHRNRAMVTGAIALVALLVIAAIVGWPLSVMYLQLKVDAGNATIAQIEREIAEKERKAAVREALVEKDRRKREEKLRREEIPEIKRLMARNDFQPAFDLAVVARSDFADDTELNTLWQQVASQWTIKTDPAGANVYLRPYGVDAARWQTPRGMTPLTLHVAKKFYHWKIELDGYSALEGSAGPEDVALTRELFTEAPEGIVLVSGSDNSIIGFDYWIDRTETTNREYKEFVDAGGYTNKDFWKYPIVKEGQVVAWDAAMKIFVDSTGQPGPKGWRNGTFADQEADYPATGVSWYEAAAYAEYRGKALCRRDLYERRFREQSRCTTTGHGPRAFCPTNQYSDVDDQWTRRCTFSIDRLSRASFSCFSR